MMGVQIAPAVGVIPPSPLLTIICAYLYPYPSSVVHSQKLTPMPTMTRTRVSKNANRESCLELLNNSRLPLLPKTVRINCELS